VLSEVERALFEVALARTRGNLTKTAELLGVNRGTLRKRLKKYGLVSDTPWRPSNARS
jgi:Fis family transcriptional regulator